MSPIKADAVDRCDLLLVTHGHFDHMGDAVALASRLRPAWPCMHEMSLWLARQLPGGADAVIGMNKGGTVEAAGLKVTMVTARPLGRRLEPGRRDDAVPGRPCGLRHRARGRVPHLPRGRHASRSPTCTLDPRPASARPCDAADRRPLTRWVRPGRRSPSSLLGVQDVMPLHYGTFPILAGTPAQLREALAGRGLGFGDGPRAEARWDARLGLPPAPSCRTTNRCSRRRGRTRPAPSAGPAHSARSAARAGAHRLRRDSRTDLRILLSA